MAHGGAQEHAHRAGTQNVPAVLSMLTALESCEQVHSRVCEEQVKLRDAFEQSLIERIPGVSIVGAHAERLWNTSMLLMPEFEQHRWVTGMEKKGFLISTGAACATGKAGPSHVLSALGLPAHKHRQSLRVSGGWDTSPELWRALANAFVTLWDELKKGKRADSAVIEID